MTTDCHLSVQQSPTPVLSFEDYEVGQLWRSADREITEEFIQDFGRLTGDTSPLHTDPDFAAATPFKRPIAHGPLGIGLYFGLLWEDPAARARIVAALDAKWNFRGAIFAGDSVHAEMTIVRCRTTKNPDHGLVNRHVRIVNQDGVEVQSGTTAVLIARDGRENSLVHRDFGTIEWASALAEILREDQEFVSGCATFDGTIGLAAGAHEVQLRVYKGQIIDITRRAPLGATFTVTGEEVAWTRLATGDYNDFVVRAGRGEFATYGDTYQYLRLSKSMSRIWEATRQLATSGGMK